MPRKDAGRASGKSRLQGQGLRTRRARREETVRDLYRLLPDSVAALQRLTRDDLRILARKQGLKGWSRLRKRELQQALAELVAGARKRRSPKTREGRKSRGPTRRQEGAPSPGEFREPESVLPASYGVTRVVLLPVDPYRIHAYWDLAPEDAAGVADGKNPPRRVLRIYDVTYLEFNGANAHGSFDIEVAPRAGNWYIDLWSPQKSLCAELGTIRRDGTFLPLARSNVVHTAPGWISPNTGERWLRVNWGGGSFPRKEAGPQRETRGGAVKPASGSKGGVPARSHFQEEKIQAPQLRRDKSGKRIPQAAASERPRAAAPARAEAREGMDPEAYRRFLEEEAGLRPGAVSRRRAGRPVREAVEEKDPAVLRETFRGEGKNISPVPKTRALALALQGFEPGRSSLPSVEAQRESGATPSDLVPEFSRSTEGRRK